MAGRFTPTSADQVAGAFARIEEELIRSIIRNLKNHRVEEIEYGFEWAAWQALQLQSLDAFARANAYRYGPMFDKLNELIEQAIAEAYEVGGSEAEAAILRAVKNGWTPPAGAPGDNPGAPFGGSFFRVPQNRLNALIRATHTDMMRAEHAILRKSIDVYRETVMSTQTYALSGAGTYAKAIDMATDDFLRKGINGIVYRNGSQHGIEEYSRMATRTAVKRAALAGDGDMRERWGVHTVIVAYNPQGCPECQEWSGQVLIDDVYSGGSAAEAQASGYALLSEAMDAGLFHPNCRDSLSTYFEGVSAPPRKPSAAQMQRGERREEREQRQNELDNRRAMYGRLADFSLDPERRRHYRALEEGAGE